MNMQKLRRKFLAGFTLSATVLVVGGFYGEPIAQASSPEMVGMVEIGQVHCGAESLDVINKTPVENTIMPCCVEKHDNSEIVTPVVLNEKIKFQQASVVLSEVDSLKSVVQKTYASSSSPPEPDIFSSCVRLE
jgi:hypothetical protein